MAILKDGHEGMKLFSREKRNVQLCVLVLNKHAIKSCALHSLRGCVKTVLTWFVVDRSEFINTSPLDHVHGITGAVTSPV